ncbi:hypothetical protein GYMLUDRAFT_46377 [Collybiopsis luxurians FD-317 M1]|uniref:Unplaced genomic scaffold GYMLUscaffold_44, whole genome shotgun sequence n=1 Tax=Collybiopsis luxurians FD-317 M1 TaxID=944289 RepID=A0A0D0B1V0_9AGAR|nr:hypothetical protein GYMLUDRAFT_46377 [Collybiopsis luxurians FD-317 M1]
MPSLFIALCFFIVSIATLAFSAPLLAARDVYNPHITSPVADTTWTCGENATVTWDGSNVPAQVTNSKGVVLLVELNGRLNISKPLASGFDVVDTHSVSFPVPQVPSGHGYSIVLMGDSGNKSGNFTIRCDSA